MSKRPRDSDATAAVEYVFAEGALFTADAFTEEMRNRIDPSEIICAQCLGRVHFVQCHERVTSRNDVRAHFKHTAQKANSQDIEFHHGYESDEHFRLKYLIARDFQSIVFKARCCDRGPFRDYTFPHAAEAIVEMTIPGTHDRPDVTLKGEDGQILAFIEVWITHRRINWGTLSENAPLNFQIKTEAWESTIGASLKPMCEECKKREPLPSPELQESPAVPKPLQSPKPCKVLKCATNEYKPKVADQWAVPRVHHSPPPDEDQRHFAPVTANGIDWGKKLHGSLVSSQCVDCSMSVCKLDPGPLCTKCNERHVMRCRNCSDAAQLPAWCFQCKLPKRQIQKAQAPFADILGKFDLDGSLGPAVGLFRMERWERAYKWSTSNNFSPKPPEEVRDILLAHPELNIMFKY